MEQRKSTSSVLWLGPSPGALGWLKTRIECRRHLVNYQPHHHQAELNLAGQQQLPWDSAEVGAVLDSFEKIASPTGRIDRIVVACLNRLSYPEELLRLLRERRPEIPTALAVDNWWDGAGRTGLRQTSHLVIPWHRWWDAWTAWLDGTDGRLYDPCPYSSLPAQLGAAPPSGLASQRASRDETGLIVANCKATGVALSAITKQCGLTAVLLSPRELQTPEHCRIAPPKPAFVLIDDSSIDTTREEEKQWTNLLHSVSELYAQALIGIVVTIPRWNTWQAANKSGATEILVKPNSGAALCRLLAECLI